jgi:hypothetical protein
LNGRPVRDIDLNNAADHSSGNMATPGRKPRDHNTLPVT